MKILFISQYFSGGGLERIIHLLGQELGALHGAKIYFYSFEKGIDPDLVSLLEKQGMRVVHQEKSQGFSWKTVFAIAKLVDDEKIEVIHSHETGPLMYAVFAKLFCRSKIKLVHTQHSFIHLSQRSFIRYYDFLFQFFADHVTVVAQQGIDEYRKIGVSSRRLQLIPNGVEFPSHLPDRQEKHALREKLMAEIPILKTHAQLLNANWLLGLSRVHPRKGQDHLIRMWKELPENLRQESYLLFTGPETQVGELARLQEIIDTVPDRDRIIFTGSTLYPSDWLRAADVFLSGSEYEGMPLSPIEACGAGLPLVLSNIEGHQVLKDAARFFPFNDPQEAAEQLSSLLEEREKNPVAFKARLVNESKKIQEQFSMATMANRFWNLYQS